MTVRAARGDDFEAVCALLEELGRPAVTDATRDDCFAVYEYQVLGPDSHHMVAEDDSRRIVAFCSLHYRTRLNSVTPEAWIADLAVGSGDAARVSGRLLLAEAERRAGERGCHALVLEAGYRRAEVHDLLREVQMRDDGKHFRKELYGT